jgi:hypothetical protein
MSVFSENLLCCFYTLKRETKQRKPHVSMHIFKHEIKLPSFCTSSLLRIDFTLDTPVSFLNEDLLIICTQVIGSDMKPNEHCYRKQKIMLWHYFKYSLMSNHSSLWCVVCHNITTYILPLSTGHQKVYSVISSCILVSYLAMW